MHKMVIKGIGLALIFSMLLTCFSMPMAIGASFKENTFIELESAKLESNYVAISDNTASGGKYIMDNVSGYIGIPEPVSNKPEVLVEFDVSKAATYYIWMRYSCAKSNQNSLFVGVNGEKLVITNMDVTGSGVWGWKIIKTASLQAGKNTLDLYHREAGWSMDVVYITSDVKYLPPGATSTKPATTNPNPGDTSSTEPTAKPSIAPSAAPSTTPTAAPATKTSGSVIIEAESTTSKGAIEIVSNDSASGGKSITIKKTEARVDDPAAFGNPAASYSFKADKAGTYTVWIRAMVASSNMNSLWSRLDDNKYVSSTLIVNDKDWSWSKLATGELQSGTHTFDMVPRESGMEIDRILITNNAGFTPSGVGELRGNDSSPSVSANLGPVVFPAPPVLPPQGHPRVYFTAKDIPRILENLKKPQNASAWEKLQSNLADSAVDALKVGSNSASNFSAAVLGVIESRAFAYAIQGDEAQGKRAVTAMRDYINAGGWGPNYNAQGLNVFTISVVYDWCYPLLTKEDKEFFVAAALAYAAKMEIGWPPTKQSMVTGHGVENQLQRDLLCAGVAMYDERPDIYLNVAGRLYKEYLKSKEFLYKSHMNQQGDGYTAYRGQWEALATMIMDAIGVPQVFGPDQKYMMYWPLYARRPDGHVLISGDSSRSNAAIGIYNAGYYRSFLHFGNYFNDPYLKQEGMREMPFLKSQTPTNNQALECVEFLIFNNPDLEGRSASELPLTKYFPAPAGEMIARTGWQDGYESPAVVAEMKINQYWTANHQHLDAGAFQIYYKGSLATDSGYYQTLRIEGKATENNGDSDYGSLHWANYYRRSIAHNTMQVYDPNEPSSNFDGGVNDGGQRIPNDGAEASTIGQLQDPTKGYQVGEIMGQEFGEDPLSPNYTYLKGDLAKAYSDKITGYERSFMFLNLKDKDHPAAMLVFDRVVASSEKFKKAWLLHGVDRPKINGSQTVFKDTRKGVYNGKLTVDTLLPKADNLTIKSIGGPGKEFWVFDTSYIANPIAGGNDEGSGWRIEVSPKKESQTDYFLNVLQMGDANPDVPSLPVTVIETDKIAGAKIADRVVIFGKEKARTKDSVDFTFNGKGEFEITVADLEKGTWQVTKDGAALTQASATDEGGVIVFKGSAGSYNLTYVNGSVNRPVIEVETPQHEGIGIRVDDMLIYTDVPPTVQNDRTLVPMRAIFEKLGVSVAYDDVTATATATKDGREVKITQDSKTAIIDGQPVELDVPATVINDRFLVPVRFVAEAFYATVEWDEFAKIVNVTSGKKPITVDGTPVDIKDSSNSIGFNGSSKETLDNNTETLWSAQGYDGHWLLYDFGDIVDVKFASIMWNNGDKRKAFFSIEVSDDKKTWKTVFDGASDGKAAFAFENIPFPEETKARYVRINTKGNSTSEWNGVIEVKFFK